VGVALAVTVLGCAIVGVALLDVLITALHPAAESRVSARFHRAVWTVVRALSHLVAPPARGAVLSWTLPLSVGGLVLSWLLAVLVGFALIYLPGISGSAPHGGGPAFRAPGLTLGWGDAFYFSGVCLTSLGFGDIVPLTGLPRAAAVGEGLTGLLVVGVAITYVLAVFPVLPLASVLALTVNEETDGQVDALPWLRRYLAVEAAEPLAQRCREVATQIMALSEAHTTHSVLFYAHPVRVERSFVRVLIVTQRLVALVRYGVRRTEYPTVVHDPRVIGLEESLIAVLRLLGSTLHVQVHAPPPEMEDGLRQEHRALLRALADAGLRGATAVDDAAADEAACAAYVRFRLVTDPYIAAYAANSGYTPADLWGNHPPLRAGSAPIPVVEEDPYSADAR